jgi:hypothetical protein
MERITPLTLEAVHRREAGPGPSRVLRETITRTANRLHVTMDSGHEWLFERNPVDPRRASGFLVRHASRAIVVYEESDLRTELGIRGWADVLALGFDAELLAQMTPTGRIRRIGAVSCAHYTARQTDGTVDVWWSEEQALPCSVTQKGAGRVTTFSIERVDAAVDRARLESPATRFGAYRVVDLAGWLEAR